MIVEIFEIITAAKVLKTDKAAYKRNMVRTAILLAHPVKG